MDAYTRLRNRRNVRRSPRTAVSKWWIVGGIFAVLGLAVVIANPPQYPPVESATSDSVRGRTAAEYQADVDRQAEQDWNKLQRARDIRKHSAVRRLQFLIDGGK